MHFSIQYIIQNSTIYTLTSVCIFSILFSVHFQRCWQGEFVKKSRASSAGGHLSYSHDLNVSLRGDFLKGN